MFIRYVRIEMNLLNILDDKIQTRSFIKSLVPMLDYCIVKGKNLTIISFVLFQKIWLYSQQLEVGAQEHLCAIKENYARILKRLS